MVDLIPRTVLFGNPERVSPSLSPDGRRLAWIAPDDGVLNVWVAPMHAGGDGSDRRGGIDWDAAVAVTADRDRGVRVYTWAHDGRHILYLQDRGGDENWRLFDVDLPTMAHRDLTPYDDVQVQLIAVDKRFPTDVLVGINRDNPELHDVYRLDLVTGELQKVLENPGFIGWVADAEMVVRAGVAPQPDGGFVLMVRERRRPGLAAAVDGLRRGRAHHRASIVHRRGELAARPELGWGRHRSPGAHQPG